MRIIRELLVSAKILENAQSRSSTDINIALEHLNRHRRKRGVCFLVSDFISEDFETDLRLAAKRHDMIAIAVSDPRELDIPDVGIVELEDSETGEIIFVDTSSAEFRNQFLKSVENETDDRETFFKSLGIDLLEINTGMPFEHSLVSFFKQRGKRR